jgi:hypothetical protein
MRYDIFSGVETQAMWLEATEALNEAVSLMKQEAHSKPGRYFVFDSQEHFVIASTDSAIGLLLVFSEKPPD